MKYRVMLIMGLLIACLIAPVLADRVDVMDTTYNHKVQVRFDKVVEKSTSDIYPPQNYPPTDYKFVTLYYSFYNPTSSDVRYEFNIMIEDQNGNYFAGENYLIAETVPANGNLLNRYKEYAIYRNSTDYYFVWQDKQSESPWLVQNQTVPITYPAPTPEPTEAVTATAQTTPTTSPNVPITNRCLPFLPIGAVIGGFGGMGILSKRFLNQRR
jgi:hypothetical protein